MSAISHEFKLLLVAVKWRASFLYFSADIFFNISDFLKTNCDSLTTDATLRRAVESENGSFALKSQEKSPLSQEHDK